MSLEFLKQVLWIPNLDENIENSSYKTSNERMILIGFDKTSVFLNYFHSFKIITLLFLVTIGFSIVWLIYKLWKRTMNFILAKFCRFFFLKSLQVILIEMYLFLFINCIYELKSPTSNGGYTFFACLCLLLVISYFFMFPVNLIFNLYCTWTPP